MDITEAVVDIIEAVIITGLTIDLITRVPTIILSLIITRRLISTRLFIRITHRLITPASQWFIPARVLASASGLGTDTLFPFTRVATADDA